MKHSPREERRYREDDMRRRGSRSGYRIPDNTEARYPGRSAEGTGRHAASLSHTRPQPPEAYLRSRQSDEARQRQREGPHAGEQREQAENRGKRPGNLAKFIDLFHW